MRQGILQLLPRFEIETADTSIKYKKAQGQGSRKLFLATREAFAPSSKIKSAKNVCLITSIHGRFDSPVEDAQPMAVL